MTWWLFQNDRFESEQEVLAQLERSVDWLKVGKWRVDRRTLVVTVDFSVTTNGELLAFQMVYPGVFPDAPPMIYTKDRIRISLHQYGSDGELCLEYRPDNWDPSITGARMVESCHRLLHEEHPDEEIVAHARSAHVPSLGRDLRSAFCRFLLTKEDLLALNSINKHVPIPLTLNMRLESDAFISSIKFLGEENSPIWTSDLMLPKSVRTANGNVVRGVSTEKDDISASELKALLGDCSLDELGALIADSEEDIHLLIGDEEEWRHFWIYGLVEDRKVVPHATVYIPQSVERVPNEFRALADKQVGIVGCGSLGSKIAASLCRSGLGKFLLIDEDIFFPGNVVRNELGTKQIGAHKVYALRDRLRELNPSCDVDARAILLGGQESSKSTSQAMSALGSCDLLIDATAEPKVFNIVASMATRNRKPMLWGEVFAGGIGGFVARARPDIDSIPILARAQIAAWCNDQGVEWHRPDDSAPYEGASEDDSPFVASDAEVALVASHVVRFAIDILVREGGSLFPYSVYMVGFMTDWMFSQPFDTQPINLEPCGNWGELGELPEEDKLKALLVEYLSPEEDDDENSSPE